MSSLTKHHPIINEPECVNKTFPTYFDVLAQLATVETV